MKSKFSRLFKEYKAVKDRMSKSGAESVPPEDFPGGGHQKVPGPKLGVTGDPSG